MTLNEKPMNTVSNPPVIRTPVKAIRAFCLSCVGNQPKEVRLCASAGCPLYPYRMGRRPPKEADADA